MRVRRLTLPVPHCRSPPGAQGLLLGSRWPGCAACPIAAWGQAGGCRGGNGLGYQTRGARCCAAARARPGEGLAPGRGPVWAEGSWGGAGLHRGSPRACRALPATAAGSAGAFSSSVPPGPHRLGLTEPCSGGHRGRLSCVGAGGRVRGDPCTRQDRTNGVWEKPRAKARARGPGLSQAGQALPVSCLCSVLSSVGCGGSEGTGAPPGFATATETESPPAGKGSSAARTAWDLVGAMEKTRLLRIARAGLCRACRNWERSRRRPHL